jgi:hypothetical protein
LPEKKAVVSAGHADTVDRQQRPVEDHEGLAAGYVEGLAKGWCEGGEDVDALTDVAEHRCGADAEPVGQGGVGLALVQMRQHQQRLLPSG